MERGEHGERGRKIMITHILWEPPLALKYETQFYISIFLFPGWHTKSMAEKMTRGIVGPNWMGR